MLVKTFGSAVYGVEAITIEMTWLFNLANITANSFTIVLYNSPFNLYRLVRTIEN